MRMALSLLLVLAASVKAAEPDAQRRSHLAIGRGLYRENCAVCHDIDKDKRQSRKFGPSLNRLFKNEKLPLTGGKPNRPYVEIRIKFGGTLMPAFAKRLTQAQIDTLIDYIDSK